MSHFILALDQGTTSSRSIVFDKQGNIISRRKKNSNKFFRNPDGWSMMRMKYGVPNWV